MSAVRCETVIIGSENSITARRGFSESVTLSLSLWSMAFPSVIIASARSHSSRMYDVSARSACPLSVIEIDRELTSRPVCLYARCSLTRDGNEEETTGDDEKAREESRKPRSRLTTPRTNREAEGKLSSWEIVHDGGKGFFGNNIVAERRNLVSGTTFVVRLGASNARGAKRDLANEQSPSFTCADVARHRRRETRYSIPVNLIGDVLGGRGRRRQSRPRNFRRYRRAARLFSRISLPLPSSSSISVYATIAARFEVDKGPR